MPDFTARPSSGVAVANWHDQASGSKASRLYPDVQAPHRRWVVASGTQVEIRATPDGGSEAPMDAALGGRLFMGWLAEYSGEPHQKPVVTSPTNQSSIQRFTLRWPGHYTFVFRRHNGGSVVMHFDVELQ